MRLQQRFYIGAAIAAILTGFSGQAVQAAQRSPVVVELFTSQGCSSCPPANANLIKLSKQPGVLALSFAVTYWDYLGWKDTFGKAEFTQRQAVYEPPLGQSGSYTPQMVVNGESTAVGNRLPEVQSLVKQASASTGPAIELGKGKITIGSGSAPSSGADIWLVRYDGGVHNVPVARGENSGETLPHVHVVRTLERLGRWTGDEASFTVSSAKGLKTAILVQKTNGGAILSAATD